MPRGKQQGEKIPHAKFAQIFDINKMHDPQAAAEMKAFFNDNGVVCINLQQMVDKQKVVRAMIEEIFGELPYSKKYLLKVTAEDGRVLDVTNPDHSEAITTELLRSPLSNENLRALEKTAPPHRQFGAPCIVQSWHGKWANKLRQHPKIFDVAKKLLGTEHPWCPINRSIIKLPKQGQEEFLHWDMDPRNALNGDVGFDELQGKVCFTDGTFVCVPGSHTKEFLDEFCNKYNDLYPGRKLGQAKYGLDPEKDDPMGLFQRQRSFTVPGGCWVVWKKELLHGHAKLGRDKGISFGCYLGFRKSMSKEQQRECEELYCTGAMPARYPSGDFFPAKYDIFPKVLESMVGQKLSDKAKAELVTTRVTQTGKEVQDIRPWGWG